MELATPTVKVCYYSFCACVLGLKYSLSIKFLVVGLGAASTVKVFVVMQRNSQRTGS